MTGADANRRNKSINALLKAKECLELEHLYLSVQNPVPVEELRKVQSALWSVGAALDRLTVEGGQTHERDSNDARRA